MIIKKKKKLNKKNNFIKYNELGKIKIFAHEDIIYFLNFKFFLGDCLLIKYLPSFVEFFNFLMEEIKNIYNVEVSKKIVFKEIFLFHILLKNMILFMNKKRYSLFIGKPLFYLKFLFRFEKMTWIFFQFEKLNFILRKQMVSTNKNTNLHICFGKNFLFRIFGKFFKISFFFIDFFKKKFLFCDIQLTKLKKIVLKNKFTIERTIDRILKNFEIFLCSNLGFKKYLIFISKIIPPIYNIVNVVEKEKTFKIFLKKELDIMSKHISFHIYCFLVFHSDRSFDEIFTNFIIISNWPSLLYTIKFLDFSFFFAKKNFF